jgi:hypothetical protein
MKSGIIILMLVALQTAPDHPKVSARAVIAACGPPAGDQTTLDQKTFAAIRVLHYKVNLPKFYKHPTGDLALSFVGTAPTKDAKEFTYMSTRLDTYVVIDDSQLGRLFPCITRASMK